MWVAANFPERAWSHERERHVEEMNLMRQLMWSLGVWDRESVPEPPVVMTPRMTAARAAAERTARSKAAGVRERLENTTWVEV